MGRQKSHTMKIVFFVAKLDYNGTAKSVINHANYYAKKNHDVYIITKHKNKEFYLDEAVRHISIDTGSTFVKHFRVFEQRALEAKIKDTLIEIEKTGKIDRIISSGIHCHRIISKLNIADVVYWLHAPISYEIKNIKEKHRAKRIKLYNKTLEGKNIVCVSGHIKTDLQKNTKVKSCYISVRPNMICFNEIRALSKLKNVFTEPYIIHVGRFSPEKRHDLLLNIYFRLKLRGIKHKLVLVTKVNDTLSEMIEKLELEKDVIVTGFVNNPYPLIAGADCLISCSDYEGFGLTILESLALKTPVVSTRSPGGIKQIMGSDLECFLTKPGCPQQLTDKIITVLQSHKSSYPFPCRLSDDYDINYSSENSVVGLA